jgi:hypothetical protein
MMNDLEQALLRQEAGGVEPTFVLRSRSKIDAGRWWQGTPVWLCVMADELLMLSVSRRRYVERVALAACRDTHYCHATGQLVIEPGEELTFSRFKMSPREALKMLSVFKSSG